VIDKLIVLFIGLYCLGCHSSRKVDNHLANEQSAIECTEKGCKGAYIGPEFINGLDIAHQFSNDMCKKVGDKLKALYKDGKYSKVDFSNIAMTTEGMGTGHVIYELNIPFESVVEKCQSYTSFDHVGGWGHTPGLSSRKTQLQKALLPTESLNISDLKTTPEGLNEYWIQWKNKDLQSDCI
jgi:hypothetical protein